MVAVTGTHSATVIVDNELQAEGDGTWNLDVAITHSNTSSGSGVRVSRKRLGEGSYTVLQTFSTSGTFHTGSHGDGRLVRPVRIGLRETPPERAWGQLRWGATVGQGDADGCEGFYSAYGRTVRGRW